MSNVDPVVDKIVVARVGLLLRHPFFGNMATRLQIVENDDWCFTAATDGRHLYYNRTFFENLTPKQVEFVVAHEILHNVFDHVLRREGRDAFMFNCAADYCVNGQLVRDRIGEQPPDIQIFHDPKYYGWSAEQVYDDLKENFSDEMMQALGQLLDQHIDWSEKDEKHPTRPTYSKEELKKIKDEVREATIQAVQTSGNNVPDSVKRLVKELTEPKMNWRELLRQQIQSTVRNDYTWQRPNRKALQSGTILPGMNYAETIDIVVALDTSGSIDDEMARDFLSEVKGIMDEYKDYSLRIWSFDTAVYNEQVFSADGSDNILEYELKGGGGTEFDCNWIYMKENGIVPKKFIMFTDGYPWESWGDESYCDTLFVIHNNKTIVPPFGSHAYYEESE